MLGRREKIVLALTFFFIFFSVLGFLFWLGRDSGLKIYFFDVGQGDSIFIETENKKQILIDGGPDNSIIQKLPQAMSFWDRTIDLVILTHPDKDHIFGLLEVLKRYNVKAVVETGVRCEKGECLAWEDLKNHEKAVVISPKLGDSISLDENTKIFILHPFENQSGKEFSKTNNTSIVAKLIYGDASFLFTGDIEKQVEEKLILAGINIDSDYLKIPHHGSKTSSTDIFLDAVSPLAAFISLGLDNRYGHPHEEVVNRLEKYSIKYYRTDVSGDILLSCKLNHLCQIKNQNQN